MLPWFVLCMLWACDGGCEVVVPDDAVLIEHTSALDRKDAGYVCPGVGGEITQKGVNVYVDEGARLVVLGANVRVWAAAGAEVTVVAPDVEVRAHGEAEVELLDKTSTLQTCGVVLEVPEALVARCAGTWVAPDTAATVDTATAR